MQIEYKFKEQNSNFKSLGYKIQNPSNFRDVFRTLAFFFSLSRKVKFFTPTIRKSTNNHSELAHVNQHIINTSIFLSEKLITHT